ncbi:hypothetical protein K3495_g11542 [Podosphaera aphanis]|nr:hypothetical protein K3495_g11542 [Podosphaera aphanis]
MISVANEMYDMGRAGYDVTGIYTPPHPPPRPAPRPNKEINTTN